MCCPYVGCLFFSFSGGSFEKIVDWLCVCFSSCLFLFRKGNWYHSLPPPSREKNLIWGHVLISFSIFCCSSGCYLLLFLWLLLPLFLLLWSLFPISSCGCFFLLLFSCFFSLLFLFVLADFSRFLHSASCCFGSQVFFSHSSSCFSCFFSSSYLSCLFLILLFFFGFIVCFLVSRFCFSFFLMCFLFVLLVAVLYAIVLVV